MLEASIKNNVKIYLYTSSYGVYNPSGRTWESQNLWSKNLSPHDFYGGWAKRTAELHEINQDSKNKKRLYPLLDLQIYLGHMPTLIRKFYGGT